MSKRVQGERAREPWGEDHLTPPPIRNLALNARRLLTPLERRFWDESHARWPGQRFRRYADIAVYPLAGTVGAMLSKAPSVWYAPFYHAKSKTIIVIEDRPDFPYRVYGQNWKLYASHGYTILDFSEDFSCPTDDSVWQEAMAMIDQALHARQAA